MKVFALCLLLIGLCYAQNPQFCSARLSTAASNIANGDFETANVDDEPWELNNVAVVPSSESGGCDGASLKVDSTSGSASIYQYQMINKINDAPFYVTAWFKGQDVSYEDSTSFIAEVDGYSCNLTIPTGTFDWTQVGAVCQSPDVNSAMNFEVRGTFSSTFSGVLYVDNVYACYFGQTGCVYDIFVNGFLLNGWTAVPTVGNVTIENTETQSYKSLSVSSPRNAVQEFRFLHPAMTNYWDKIMLKVANPLNPVFISVGPIKPKTFVYQSSSFADVYVPINTEDSLTMILCASIPTNYFVTSVGMV